MNKIWFVVLVMLCFSFRSKQKKGFIPPGTVQITESLFIDETEISNLSWLEYEYWTAIKYGRNSPQHLAVLPDTTVWRTKEFTNEPYVVYYYRHVAYRQFPVVGISYGQAIEFCKWRTERVKEFYAIAHKKELMIEYLLPTKKEWEFVSMSSNNFLGINGRDERGHATINCARDINDTILIDKRKINGKFPDVTVPVINYKKNFFGLYNSLGNVAEMILEEGICKGGSWLHPLQNCKVGLDQVYTEPTAWIGFRCVCKVQTDS